MAYPEHILTLALKKAKKSHFNSKDSVKTKRCDFENTLIVPYVKHLENFKPALKSMDKDVVFQYKNKISNILCHNKLSKSNDKAGVYEVACKGCDKIYIGETGRNLAKRISEHKYDVRKNKESSALAVHSHDEGHDFNFENAKLLYRCNDLKKRRIVESSLISISDRPTVNLNKGFYLINQFASKSIAECLNLKDKT